MGKSARASLVAPVKIRAMESALIGWHEMWWRSPSDGRSPWAKDGPWNLAQREVGDIAGHYSLTLLVNEAGRELVVRKIDSPRPRSALSPAEVSARDAIGCWIEAIPVDDDRVMVLGATQMLWRGEGRVEWKRLARRLRSGRSADGLRGRYGRVLAEMVCRANSVPVRWAKALVTRDCVLAVGQMA